MPDGVVAIVHTHPVDISAPSPGDCDIAARMSIPIFVLTPLNIYVATRSGESVALVRNAEWTRETAEEKSDRRMR